MGFNSETIGILLLICVAIAWGISLSDFVGSVWRRRWTVDDTLILLVHVIFPVAIVLTFYME